MANLQYNNFLALVISQPRSSIIDSDHLYRRSSSIISTSSRMGGVEDTRLHKIIYEVGRRFSSVDKALSKCPSKKLRIDATYPMSTVLAQDFVTLAGKYTNFSS